MAENNMINFKAYLMNPDLLEVRRFTVDASAVTNYMFMREKLQAVFPILKNATFKITWKDEDEDTITISSDEELITALTEMVNNLKMLYIQIEQQNEEKPGFVLFGETHGPTLGNHYPISNVVCDVCEKHITGYRYKCMQCPDYDLCADCEHKGNHAEHLMVRSSQTNFTLPKSTRRYVHQINRSLREGANLAAGHCRRSFGRRSKCPMAFSQECNVNRSTVTTDNARPGEHQQGSANETNPSSRPNTCPFQSAQPNDSADDEAMNLNNFVDLAANLARQHLNPFVEVLHNATAQNPEAPPVTIADLLGAFLGKPPQQNPAATPESTPASNVNNAQTAAAAGAQNTTNVPQEPQQQQQQPQQPTPMDIPIPERHVTFLDVEMQKLQPTTSAEPSKPAEPGWTFVGAPTGGPNASITVSSASTSPEVSIVSPVTPSPVVVPPPMQPTAPQAPLHRDPVIAAGLARLQEMGFSDTSEWLVHLLEHNNGNVGKTVEAIINNKFR